jgi:hypothetical protein
VNRLVVVAPLKEGAYEAARRIIEGGRPPIDLEATAYDRHYLFLTRNEVVFFFEGPGPQRPLELGGEDPAVWQAAEAWQEHLGASPRVAQTGFAWTRGEEPVGLFFAGNPGPGDSEGGDVYSPSDSGG